MRKKKCYLCGKHAEFTCVYCDEDICENCVSRGGEGNMFEGAICPDCEDKTAGIY